MHLARSKKLRQQQGKILLEGRRLISDALDAGAFPLTVFFSTVERLRELPVNKLAQASLVKVKLQDIQICPDLEVAVDMIGNILAGVEFVWEIWRDTKLFFFWYNIFYDLCTFLTQHLIGSKATF